MNSQKLSEAFVESYYLRCNGKFEEAIKTCGAYKRYYQIADTTVCLKFAGDSLLQSLTNAIAHLQIEPIATPQLTINVWDSLSSKIAMLPPPCPWKDFTHRGDIFGAPSEKVLMAFHWPELSFNIFHKEKKEAVYWVKDPTKFHYWVRSSPFRTIFGWWVEQNQGQLLHAAAVGTSHGAIVISGRGGLGKSSTAVKALDAGLLYLADDYLIVKNNPEPTVYSLYSTAKIMRFDLEKYPRLKPALAAFENPGQEKGVFYLYPSFKNQIRRSLPIVALFTPKVVDSEESSLAAVEGADMLQAMAFTTTTQIPHSGEYTQAFLQELTRKVPTAKLQLGRNTQKLTGLLSNISANPAHYLSQIKQAPILVEWPLLTVIIPSYNGGMFLEKAINSVFKQNYPALELIVVDDGSTDNTADLLKNLSANFLYLKQNNKGPAAARNLGIKNANGSLIAFLDVDDHWPDNFLKRYAQELMSKPQIMVLRGFGQLFRYTVHGKKEFLGNPAESYLHYIGAAIYRKEAFTRVGLFDDNLIYGEDDDWHIRATEKQLSIERLNEVGLFVQRHSANMTLKKEELTTARLKVFKKKLNRLDNNERINELLINPNYVTPNYAEHEIGFVINTLLYPEINIQKTIKEALKHYPTLHFLIISAKAEFSNHSTQLKLQHVLAGNAVEGMNRAIEESPTELLYFYNPHCELQTEVLKRLMGILTRRTALHFVLSYAKENPVGAAIPMLDSCLGIFKRSFMLKHHGLQEMNPQIAWLDFFYRLREEGEIFSFVKSGGALFTPQKPTAEALHSLHQKAKNRDVTKNAKAIYPQTHQGAELLQFLQIGSL